MLRFKDLIERVNETRSFYLEEDKKLIKAKDNGSYPAHHDHITHDTYGDAGDEATSAHHKFASERAPVHTFKHLGSTHKIYHHPNGSTIHTMEHTHGHHGDDIAVYSGHHDPKHIENQEKKHSNMNEEVEELDEANENFDSNSKAHQAAKKAVKGWRGLSKATYHPDGSATINTKERTKNRYGKEGHYSGLETTHSHSVVDQTLKHAGGMHNHSRDELDNHHQKIDGLHWKVKGKATSYGDTHEIHIHEEVDLDESRMKDLAMDMESLSHADFKKKHRRSKQQMQDALKSEELKGNQHKIDANKNGKVDGHDFKILRNAKKARYQ